MQEPYPVETDTQEYNYPPAPKRGMSGWLIALLVILGLVVICCLCACLALALSGPLVGNVFSDIIITLEAATPMP